MKKLLLLYVLSASVWVNAQTEDSLRAEIKAFQDELNEHYLDKEHSPLKKKERRHFKGHRFFDVDLSYRVVAKVKLIENPDTIIMPTSAGTQKKYVRYAELRFNIHGTNCKLIAYKFARQMGENYLFVPFRDATSGGDSYGGGRYMDLVIPSTEEIILNFNLAYNPYCAYTTGWFCPLPPDENTLDVEIRAGLMAPEEH